MDQCSWNSCHMLWWWILLLVNAGLILLYIMSTENLMKRWILVLPFWRTLREIVYPMWGCYLIISHHVVNCPNSGLKLILGWAIPQDNSATKTYGAHLWVYLCQHKKIPTCGKILVHHACIMFLFWSKRARFSVVSVFDQRFGCAGCSWWTIWKWRLYGSNTWMGSLWGTRGGIWSPRNACEEGKKAWNFCWLWWMHIVMECMSISLVPIFLMCPIWSRSLCFHNLLIYESSVKFYWTGELWILWGVQMYFQQLLLSGFVAFNIFCFVSFTVWQGSCYWVFDWDDFLLESAYMLVTDTTTRQFMHNEASFLVKWNPAEAFGGCIMEMACHFEGLYNNFRGLPNKVKMAKVPPLVSVSSLVCMCLSRKISQDHVLAPASNL